MVISAQDGGGLFSLVNAKVNISVVAGLLAPPVFEHTQYHFSVSEDVLRGTVVGIVQASIKTGGAQKHILTHSFTHSLTHLPDLELYNPYWTVPWIILKFLFGTTCTNRH